MTKKLEYTVINIKEYLKVKPSGEFDKDQTHKLLVNFLQMIEPRDSSKVLLDIRDAFPMVPLTVFDIFELVQDLIKIKSHNKIAVLTREDFQIDNARFFELCAENRGLEVKAFTNYELAIDWFADIKTYNILDL